MVVWIYDLKRIAKRARVNIDELVASAIAQGVENWVVMGDSVIVGYDKEGANT